MSFTSLLIKGLKKGLWVWDDERNELKFVRSVPEKRVKKEKETGPKHAINGLTYATMKVNLTFRAKVTERELMHFRNYLKKKNENRKDSIVTIQDIKLVAIFLCRQQLPKLFHTFYNLKKVNQLLRVCIVYIQFYLQTCEFILKLQHLIKAKPIDPTKVTTFQAMKDDLDDLRVLIGRFYAGIILGELGSGDKNRDISKTDEILLFEYFLRVSTVVVWIALERKYLETIKIELGRIFRTAHFNHFVNVKSDALLGRINQMDQSILIGKIGNRNFKLEKRPDPLRSNSPIIHNFLLMDEPILIMIGRKDFQALRDDRLRFLTDYVFKPETDILEHGVKMGILGYHRRLFDHLLYPCSKRTLKLLITGSPMDITDDRKKLREVAAVISHIESEPITPHIFDYLQRIPRPNQLTNTEDEMSNDKEGDGTDDKESDDDSLLDDS